MRKVWHLLDLELTGKDMGCILEQIYHDMAWLNWANYKGEV